MTIFLILCAVMVVAAVAMVLVPLLRNEPVAKGEAAKPRAVPAAVAVLVALPLLASAFYGATSNFPWDNPEAVAAAGGDHAQGSGSMDEVTAQLEARLRQNPGDAEGWRMLGRTYLVSGRADDAVAAYERASAVTGGNDAAVELDLAEALVLTDQPANVTRAKGMLDAALAADASNQKALWYAGLLAARGGDAEAAKASWTKLLEQNPPEEIREILVNQLQQLGAEVPQEASTGAGAAMGGMGATGEAPAAGSASGRTLRLAVSVAPELASRLEPGTPVFVSAREAGIPGPPLAAVRLSSDELPTTVILSDANSMIEGRNLSSVNEVQVVARVAFGGTAVTTSGDLVGEARHAKGAPADLDIVIDKVTP